MAAAGTNGADPTGLERGLTSSGSCMVRRAAARVLPSLNSNRQACTWCTTAKGGTHESVSVGRKRSHAESLLPVKPMKEHVLPITPPLKKPSTPGSMKRAHHQAFPPTPRTGVGITDSFA
ncbi:uncharacterized protein LOC123520866 isoform X2 [Portunus trituberculatus]|uniref:uncharacterized protein LOC123520866 isoform X2 n=1 Tax=Portunus trituberculatus TaxID=210409 RepID=UPI001E1D1817|nr:uncharacterized protein LOC123520866 isoform X2 [Portunus trituberculatus]